MTNVKNPRDAADDELSAHDILLSHVTNVSDVTANVIRRAVAEHYELLKRFNELSLARTPEGAAFLLAGLCERIQLAQAALAAVATQAHSLQLQSSHRAATEPPAGTATHINIEDFKHGDTFKNGNGA